MYPTTVKAIKNGENSINVKIPIELVRCLKIKPGDYLIIDVVKNLRDGAKCRE